MPRTVVSGVRLRSPGGTCLRDSCLPTYRKIKYDDERDRARVIGLFAVLDAATETRANLRAPMSPAP